MATIIESNIMVFILVFSLTLILVFILMILPSVNRTLSLNPVLCSSHNWSASRWLLDPIFLISSFISNKQWYWLLYGLRATVQIYCWSLFKKKLHQYHFYRYLRMFLASGFFSTYTMQMAENKWQISSTLNGLSIRSEPSSQALLKCKILVYLKSAEINNMSSDKFTESECYIE